MTNLHDLIMYVLWYDSKEKKYRLDFIIGVARLSFFKSNEMDVLYQFDDTEFNTALKVVNSLNRI